MPQRNQLTWGELRVGLFVLAGVTLLIVAIFYVTGFGVLTAKYRLRAFLPEVSGLTTGAPVRVDGIDVGNVDKLVINTPTGQTPPDPGRNIEVIMRIETKYQDVIRSDSKASLITEGLLGNRYVNISRGFTGKPLADYAEVPGLGENGINQLLAQGANLAEHLNSLADSMQGMIVDVRAGHGSLGKFITDDSAYDHLESVSARLDTMLGSIQSGEGSIGKLYTSDSLYKKIDSAAGHADNVIEAVQQQKGTIGKLVYDPTLHDKATQLMTRGTSLLDDVQAGKGTIGKLAKDDSLFNTWKEAGTNISAATAKLNSNEGTAGKLFSDPKLYDNLTGLTADMRLLLSDFRQNPKKFLRVKFSIF